MIPGAVAPLPHNPGFFQELGFCLPPTPPNPDLLADPALSALYPPSH